MEYDVAIVGGGIVGLATALRLLEQRPDTQLVLIEKEDVVARHQTGNNSGVIHSGLYYKPGSLKALNCRNGYRQMLDFCDAEQIPHEICGKIVVATAEEELPRLEELRRRGEANGLTGLRDLGPEEIREIEPHCTGIRGLFVPQTGIVDYAVVSGKYAEKIRARGGEIRFGEKVERIRNKADGMEIATSKGAMRAKMLVACAGLHSDRLARETEPDLPLRITPFRGEYFVLKPEARRLVKHLIYPVPEGYRKTDFNLTDTLETLAWPGFQKVARKYWRTGLGEFHRSFSKAAFVRALQRLIPEIRAEHLEPGGAGIRAQACHRDGRLLDDFHILEQNRVIHVCNAPSPAATSSLAIGATIAQTLIHKL
jgi:L-2-hydroxyglutarate oxidase